MMAVNDNNFVRFYIAKTKLLSGEHDNISAPQELKGHNVITTLQATAVIILIMYSSINALKDLQETTGILYLALSFMQKCQACMSGSKTALGIATVAPDKADKHRDLHFAKCST